MRRPPIRGMTMAPVASRSPSTAASIPMTIANAFLPGSERGNVSALCSLVGAGLRLRGGGRAAGDLPGEGPQHARAGYPAVHALSVRRQHRQAVAPVNLELAQ